MCRKLSESELGKFPVENQTVFAICVNLVLKREIVFEVLAQVPDNEPVNLTGKPY